MFSLLKWLNRSKQHRVRDQRKRPSRPRLEALEDRVTPAADPVLLVMPNSDFWYADYAETTRALNEMGVDYRIASTTTDLATPQYGSGYGGDGGLVQPDIALADVDASDYSAIAFVGGWGASSYQYGFNGAYANASYNGPDGVQSKVNELIGDFLEQDKNVAGVCYGVSVLAWARVDGVSPLAGRTITGWQGAGPWSTVAGSTDGSWHLTVNGANVVSSGAIGQVGSADDVIVDGKIITAENFESAYRFGQVLAEQVIAASVPVNPPPTPETPTPETPVYDTPLPETPPAAAEPLPVLLVIANQDFYYKEYGDTRKSLEAAGLNVVVAAGNWATCIPHAFSGQGDSSGEVTPDVILQQVDASDYSAIVFVGGWGASSYQYAFEGTYQHGPYNGEMTIKDTVNSLITDFTQQDKVVAAVCHGVSVLAWARVDGVSPIAGKTVSGYNLGSPPRVDHLPHVDTTRWQIESNGATMVPSGSIGIPDWVNDDVMVDGKIITAENYDSAREFGRVIAQVLLEDM